MENQKFNNNLNKKKRILLIAPLFFGYYKEIIQEAELMGYSVDYVCDAPSNSNLSKAVGRINKRFLNLFTKKYYRNEVLPLISGKTYDYILVIAGMTFSFTPSMVESFRNRFKEAKFIIYQWDSEKNIPYVTGIHPFFDEKFSFDIEDCERDKSYKFLPLFYTRIYEQIGSKEKTDFKYDCSYVGTAHPLKYKNINSMAEALKDVLPRQLIYHYMPSKLKYYYHKVFSPEYNNAKKTDFKWEKVATNDMMKIIEESKCILDSPQEGQTGLTIRTIECLGAKRKLITSNSQIKRYDFYKEENIIVYPNDIGHNSSFFSSPYQDIEWDIYNKYSLKSWLTYMISQ